MSKYAGIIKDDVTNGKGIGLVFFVQGCLHHCKGCHNPETWDFNGGLEFTQEVLNEIIDYFKKNLQVTRLTLSGGDPIFNSEVALVVAKNIKEIRPDVKIWTYTGYLFEQIKEYHLLKYTDVLIDGPFILEKRDISLPFRGSSNQRIIDVKKSLEKGEIILYSL